MSILGFDRTDVRFILNMWRLNLVDRYLGSALGGAWAVLNPLLMFAVFTFVFGFVFKARLPGADSTLDYSIWLICGYGPWLANTEALTAAASSVVSNAGMVKNMAFKTETLPLAAVLLGLIPLGVSIIFLLGLQLTTSHGWQASLLWLPLIITIQFVFLSAIGLVFAVITTFIRDFGILLPNLLMMVLFATPIFYPISAIPNAVKIFVHVNPIYIIASSYRASLLGNEDVPALSLLVLGLISTAFLIIGLIIFRRVKGFFTTVL